MDFESLVRRLIDGGYTVKTSKGGGQVKVLSSVGEVVTAFRLADGVAVAQERLRSKGVAV